MGIIAALRRLAPADVDALLDRPERVWLLLTEEPYDPPPPRRSLLDRLLGRTPPAPEPPPPDPWTPAADAEEIDLDKAWHGLHVLLCGEVDGGEGPLAFLTEGGTEIGEIDVGYGPARAFTAEETAAVADAVRAVSRDDLAARFDPHDLMRQDVYPGIWDWEDDEALEYLLHFYDDLQAFLERARSAGQGMIVYFS